MIKFKIFSFLLLFLFAGNVYSSPKINAKTLILMDFHSDKILHELEPDMSIAGLVNVRSINRNHPDDKIHPITLTSTPYNSTTINNAAVNKKFTVMFNGVKYDMLLSDTNPVGTP